MVDPHEQQVFEAGQHNRYAIGANRVMDASYSGLFAGFAVTISFHPSVAQVLAIGSPPWSSMGVVGLLLVISLLLGAMATVLIRRERQLIDARSDFIARVSHELRTPLTQIRMFTESILLGRLPEPEAQVRALKIINRETLRLSHLVENILSFSRVSDKPLVPEPAPYALMGLLNRLKEEFELQLEALGAQLDVHCDQDHEVIHNRDGLLQLLTILLDNALKYGPENQHVTLTARRSGDLLQIFIQDQGPGIPQSEQEKIWRPYYRLDKERRRGIAGTGIGLAVAKDIAAAIGAEMSMKSSPNGSCFIVKLPQRGGHHG